LLLNRYFPALKHKRLLKTGLWDEAKNSQILFWAAEQGTDVTGPAFRVFFHKFPNLRRHGYRIACVGRKLIVCLLLLLSGLLVLGFLFRVKDEMVDFEVNYTAAKGSAWGKPFTAVLTAITSLNTCPSRLSSTCLFPSFLFLWPRQPGTESSSVFP
jgi:hypothetical protein